jgi:hypothetical protein
MADASSLRTLLRKTDATAPAIQATAGAMMKHYDRSPAVAVTEWRNALHQARLDQHLPLLYVANEVLQNSKRNRGNKFLEAFSPILGQAVVFMSQSAPPSQVERVRRTVKIWGDRHVFSIRFVNELLNGLEPYRNGEKPQQPANNFSPVSKPEPENPKAETKKDDNDDDFDRKMSMDNPSDSNDPAESSSISDDDGPDDGVDLFGDSGERLLNVGDLDLSAAAALSVPAATPAQNRKRRRGSNAASNKSPRRKTILTTNSLMELWNQVSTQQQSYDHVQTLLADITPDYLDEDTVQAQVDTLVGDELLNEYKKVVMYQKRVVAQRKELHSIARKRRQLELEAVRYLPWLEHSLIQDEDDVAFCQKTLKNLGEISHVHALAKEARNKRHQEEARRQLEQEELREQREEEEERKKFMESALSKVTEAEPGMVWNKATGEYQHLRTDESWRD